MRASLFNSPNVRKIVYVICGGGPDFEEVYTFWGVLLAPVASVRSNPEKLGKTL
jgi:hypothetical protein